MANIAEMAYRFPPESIVFLENYNMELGKLLTSSCDIWLNTPQRPPLEASATSGMKAALNGVLHLSVLDGWWPEGCLHGGVNGWQFGGGYEGPEQTMVDAVSLYEVLLNEVIPVYYEDRNRWQDMMRASIAMAMHRFSSKRMLTEYYNLMYHPSTTLRRIKKRDHECYGYPIGGYNSWRFAPPFWVILGARRDAMYSTDYERLKKRLALTSGGGETNWLANLANTAAFIFQELRGINWAGFYLLEGGSELVLGPFQGKPACVRIAVGNGGVCGTAAQRRQSIVVPPDVHKFPGHIACDPASRSEVVIPMIAADGRLLGVLDVDSPPT